MFSICAVMPMSVIGQNSVHELRYSHVNELAYFVDHDSTIYLVLGLIELKLSLLFLNIKHDSSGIR